MDDQTTDPQYLINVHECSFNNVGSSTDGGSAVHIKITQQEPTKPILINNCDFKAATATGDDEDQEMGGSIYFYYSPPASAKTLLEGEPTTTDDFVLKIADCNFESCEASCYGGAIYLSILDKELSKPIEINHCTFKYGKISNSESKNEDERGIGSSGEIYYQYKSILLLH